VAKRLYYSRSLPLFGPLPMPNSSRLKFREVLAPIEDPVSKFGGQPIWLEEPVAPLSRRTGKPMTFVCQIAIPSHWHENQNVHLAYVFMTGAGFDDNAVETWNPEDGETAVIIQGESSKRPILEHYPDTLRRWEERDGKRMEVPCEYAIDETPAEEAAYVPLETLDDIEAGERESALESWRGNKIGGSPYWVQFEEFPYEAWRLLLQLEDGTYPFSLNLGTGVGYVFIDSACTEGQLLWQC